MAALMLCSVRLRRKCASSIAHVERGFVLPVLILALLGGSALLLTWPLASPALDERSRRPLARARLALLAHVAAYPESYGPLGAGPGHLPCPDSDGLWRSQELSSAAASMASFSGDGPDPPCGTAAVAIGHLPRHVSLPGRRELFHAEDAQLWWYVVSADWVNNPARAGIAERGSAALSASAPGLAAAIIDPSALSLQERRERMHAARTSNRVEDAVARLQGGAIARVFVPHGVPAGGRVGQSIVPAIVPAIGLTRQALHRAASLRVSAWLTERARMAADSLQSCQTNATAVSNLPARHWILDIDPAAPCRPVRDTGIAGIELDAVLIEQVPASRHWFVRGGWHRQPPVTTGAATVSGSSS